MDFFRSILILLFFFISPLYAEGEPLNVGIQSFNPPFEIQGANNQIYGFDIDMMNSLCKIMNRTCKFHLLKFDKLLDAVATKKIDVALSSITITAERAELVNFSLPYLLSHSRFLTNHTNTFPQPFTLDSLTGKTIGIEEGTIFGDQIAQMGITNVKIKSYATMELLVEGLGKNEVDCILFDSPTAVYWDANSQGEFSVIGPRFLYGNGYGIAVSKDNSALIKALNRALLQYENSPDYKVNYNNYLDLQ